MVTLAALTSALSMTFLAITASAAPTVLETRQTTSAIDFTLYKTTQAGYEDQCWTPVEVVHVAPADIGRCFTAPDFYTLQIDSLANDWNCFVNVYTDENCLTTSVGGAHYDPYNWTCSFPTSLGAVNLRSWSTACLLPPGSE